jgi:hypothetical protein
MKQDGDRISKVRISNNMVKLKKTHRVLQKELYNVESLYKFIQKNMYSVLNCHNIAKLTKFYLG